MTLVPQVMEDFLEGALDWTTLLLLLEDLQEITRVVSVGNPPALRLLQRRQPHSPQPSDASYWNFRLMNYFPRDA